MNKFILLFCLVALPAWGQDYLNESDVPVDSESEYDWGRGPASTSQSLTTKRAYPGGADEEDLRVQPTLPEAALKTDTRSVQREVFKSLYNQELKDDRHDPVEE